MPLSMYWAFLQEEDNWLTNHKTIACGAVIILVSVLTILWCFYKVLKLSDKLELLIDSILTEQSVKIARLSKIKKKPTAMPVEVSFFPRSSTEVIFDKSKLSSIKDIPRGELFA